jgi:formylglycine-generating enzyme required for sulfatase activity
MRVGQVGMRGQLEQMMQRVDAWSPRLATGVGLAGFFVVSLLLTRLPVWGFVAGCCLLSAAIVWLALSAKPVFKVVYPAAPSPTLVRPNPLPVASLPTVEPASAKALAEPIEMIELPGGEFWMGSPPRAPGRRDDEVWHQVKVSAFTMAQYPVTQKLLSRSDGRESQLLQRQAGQ